MGGTTIRLFYSEPRDSGKQQLNGLRAHGAAGPASCRWPSNCPQEARFAGGRSIPLAARLAARVGEQFWVFLTCSNAVLKEQW